MKRSAMIMFSAVVIGLALLVIFLFRPGAAQQEPAAEELPAEGQVVEADPQRLLIPRWFLRSLTVEGREVPIAADQQEMTIQFEEDGKANGGGGCNNFFTNYQVGDPGALTFGPIGATKMMCERIDLETDYFQALSQVENFNTADFKLTLTSADGSTRLVFEMPPK